MTTDLTTIRIMQTISCRNVTFESYVRLHNLDITRAAASGSLRAAAGMNAAWKAYDTRDSSAAWPPARVWGRSCLRRAPPSRRAPRRCKTTAKNLPALQIHLANPSEFRPWLQGC